MWLATGSMLIAWGRMPSSGPEIAAIPYLLALADSLPLAVGKGLYVALLWYSLNPLFYEQARLVRTFHGKVLSLSLSFFFFFNL